jgi:uncharacterized protein YjbI with pentapeptide repeats
VSWTHHAWLFADLVLLVWFFGRLRGDDSWPFLRAPIRRKVALCWLPAAVLAVDLLWLEVPRPASKTVGQDLTGYLRQYPKAPASLMERIRWVGSFQPIDLLLCTPGAWGCRFLTVAHRVIVAKVWDTATFVALRAGADFDEAHRASFEVASLRQRSLRFADLNASELFGGDLTGAGLTGAYLIRTALNGATLTGAILTFATLTGATLTRAILSGATLTGAILTFATLTGATLTRAILSGAILSEAHLDGAHLTGAILSEAHLDGAHLTGATLTRATLTGAILTGAILTGAKNLIQKQLDEACGTDTKLSPGLTLNKPCPSSVK